VLVGDPGQRIEPLAGPAGEDDPSHSAPVYAGMKRGRGIGWMKRPPPAR
jgi:hypothetical protein